MKNVGKYDNASITNSNTIWMNANKLIFLSKNLVVEKAVHSSVYILIAALIKSDRIEKKHCLI